MMSNVITTMAGLDISRIRADLEPFQSELAEEFYQSFAGLKDDMSTVPVYNRYPHLFSEDALKSIAAKLEEEESEDTRWLRYLRSFATLGYMDNALKELTDRSVTMEAQAEVELDGRKIPYRAIQIELRNEPNRERRERLFEAKLPQTDVINAVLKQRMESFHDLSAQLGFKNYCELCSSLKGVDYRSLEEQLEELLSRTERSYADAMEDLIELRIGVPLAEAWSWDIPYAFRGEEFDTFFAKDKLVEGFSSTLKGMGLDPDRQGNIHVDLEERPKKTPRAFCAPVKVPDDIRLVIMPVGGWKDFESFFHEGGHAWHFANTDGRLPAEYRYLGDNSVSESFAFLLESLTSDRLWLQKILGMHNPEDYIKFAMTNKLMFLRRYAAKLTYELKLHNSRVSQEFGEVYRTCLQKALKFKHTEKHYLEDVDDAFYCAEYLRAWILDAQLREALSDEFGEDWFTNGKSGSRLKELWSYGQKFKAEELVKTVGFVDLDPDPLIREVERGLTG